MLIGAILLAIGCFVGAMWGVKRLRLDYNRKQVLYLLLWFIGVTALFSAIWKGVSLWLLKPVRIYADAIETPYGYAKFSNMLDFYVKIEPQYRSMQQNMHVDTTKFFYLIERTGKNHVLSEGDYPVDSILVKLNIVLDTL